MDKFPEAFERFENDVDISKFVSYMELTSAFRWWSGEKWIGTPRQWEALNKEAKNVGFEVPEIFREEMRESRSSGYVSRRGQKTVSWRRDVVNVRGKSRERYRDIRTGRFIKKP